VYSVFDKKCLECAKKLTDSQLNLRYWTHNRKE